MIHVLRNDPAFVKELDFVMEKDGRLIGQNVFVRTVINADDGRDIDVLTMGPICIAPELKRKGYGKLLLDYSLEKAAEMGFGAVLFEGNIDFYGRIKCSVVENLRIGLNDRSINTRADGLEADIGNFWDKQISNKISNGDTSDGCNNCCG